MTEPETQTARRAIAEYMGYSRVRFVLEGISWGRPPGGGDADFVIIPDYTQDLAAMYQVEERLIQEGLEVLYDTMLCRAVERTRWEPTGRSLWHASAEQRALAAYKVIGARGKGGTQKHE